MSYEGHGIWRVVHALRRGMRAGVRLFRASPGIAFTAVVALGMGIGFSTTMFSIVRGGTRPLPFTDAAQIVAFQKVARGTGTDLVTRPYDFNAWAEAHGTFSAVAAFTTMSANLSAPGDAPERVSGAMLSAGALDLLGVGPSIGRAIAASDTRGGADPVVLLSHALWQRRFDGDRAIVGRSLRIDGVPHVVIGVMPAGFGFPIHAALWTPLPDDGRAGRPGEGIGLQVFGRLRETATIGGAKAEIEILTRRLAIESPSSHGAIGVDVVPYTEIETPRDVIRGLYLLLVAASGVLFIACANIATLFIARATARARDIAVRRALGASRLVLVVEQVGESIVLSGAGGALGLLFATLATGVFRDNTAHIIEAFWVDFRVDAVVVLYAAVLAAAGAAGAALLPALRASRSELSEALRDGAHGGASMRLGRLSRSLVTAQLAFAGGVIGLTFVLTQSAVALHALAWPFDGSAVLAADLGMTQRVLDDAGDRTRTLVALTREVQNIAGARAGLTSALPGRGSGRWGVSIDRTPDAGTIPATTQLTMVSPGYFDVIGASALRGRVIGWQDAPAAPLAAVVNRSFAARFSSDADPIGRRVFIGQRELTIVGIVPDLMPGDIEERRQDGVYASILQLRPHAVRLMAAGPSDPLLLTPAIRAAVARVDPDLPIHEVFTVRDAALRDKAALDVIGGLFGAFGLGALILTAIGLYSVAAFAVSQRTREFGIRAALGASRRDVLTIVARQALWQSVIGLGAGLLLAYGLARAFASAFDAVAVPQVPVLAGVFGCLAVTTIVALAGPAWRATRIDPIVALRGE